MDSISIGLPLKKRLDMLDERATAILFAKMESMMKLTTEHVKNVALFGDNYITMAEITKDLELLKVKLGEQVFDEIVVSERVPRGDMYVSADVRPRGAKSVSKPSPSDKFRFIQLVGEVTYRFADFTGAVYPPSGTIDYVKSTTSVDSTLDDTLPPHYANYDYDEVQGMVNVLYTSCDVVNEPHRDDDAILLMELGPCDTETYMFSSDIDYWFQTYAYV